MSDKPLSVLDLLDLDLKEHDSLSLKMLGGRRGLSRKILLPDLNRPGLALFGFYELFAWQRIQIFGRGEVAFLKKLESEGKTDTIKGMFEKGEIPCCIFTFGNEPTEAFFEEAERSGCPLMQTDLETADFVARLTRILSVIFAPKKIVHGELVEVYGLGILILGESGVGKSETALELIRLGHRLVADDVVEIHRVNGNILLGFGANKIIGHHMEIRGIGVVNITYLFGANAIRDQKRLQLVVKLENWDVKKNYDRLGTEDVSEEILGVNVPCIEIAIKPGRNIPALIETAAMNQRLKNMGYHAAREFNHNILKWIESQTTRSVYYGQHDII
ncbi:MAG: HPr(Ser) kinase/phosphatase [Spirochaetaceae bacterium]|jgi:HPr kinase/phosphorylase|nr:HPr(Ser) kinase/phosphatase [Spirochaetaceae bacterium]